MSAADMKFSVSMAKKAKFEPGLRAFLFDKNSLLGRGSILGKQLCVKGNCAQDLGFVWGRFSGDSGGFRGRGGEGGLSTICRGPAGFFEAHPGTPVPPAVRSGVESLFLTI